MTNPKSDGDSPMDRLLRETLEARAASDVTAQCLDAETAAAWAAATLSARERSLAEAHAADCARCQALLAAMVKTEPPAVARPWWRVSTIAWLAPVTAAAAALVIWIVVPGHMTLNRVERDAVAVRSAPATTAPADAKPSDDRLKEQAARATATSTLSKDAAPPASRSRSTDARRDQRQNLGLEKREAAAVPPPMRDERRAAAPPPVAEAPIPAAPAAASPAAAPTASAASPAFARPAAAAGTTAQASEKADKLSARALADAAMPLPNKVIASANARSQWRIVTGGAVQHSTDGGSTWDLQQTGATTALIGGASPSPSICWLVGRAGLVLLSIDGRSWQRVAFPEPIDLASVHATDAKAAIVTASDGRRFATTDGGATWSSAPR